MSTTLPPLSTEVGTIPFSRLLKAELRKLTDTRASRWLLAAIFAATPIAALVMTFVSEPEDLTYEAFVNIASTPQKYLLPILGILSVTSEWSQRTGLLTFTLEPNRARVLLAKVGATLILASAVLVLTFGSSAVGNLLGATVRDGDGSWAGALSVTGDITIVLLVFLAQGLAFGMLFLISAAAIVAFFLLPNLSGVVFGRNFGLEDLGGWVDLNQGVSQFYDHDLTGQDWAQVATSVLIWVVLPGAIGVLRVLRAEIKTA